MQRAIKMATALTCAAVSAALGNVSIAEAKPGINDLFTKIDTTKPNIILITSDQQRLDTLGCYGSTFALSPNADRLAREGVRFTDSFSVSPVCMPCRASWLTGVHTPIHGIIENATGSRDESLYTYPEFLKTQGYRTILMGKTHFGADKHYFDVFEHYAESNPNDPKIAQRSIEEIQKAVKDGVPFFVHASMLAPHGPFPDPAKNPDFSRWLDHYKKVDLPPLNYKESEFDKIPEMLKIIVGLDKAEDDTNEKTSFRDEYYAYASLFDEQLGKILDYLDKNKLREKTLIIFTSDHGFTLGDHGINDKHSYYNASWRVPLIISQPGTIPQGQTREFAVSTDVTATILSAAGINSKTVQGFDLYNPLKKGQESPRKCGVATVYTSQALCTKRFKFAYYNVERVGQLFDLKLDPLEQNDLFNNPKYAAVQKAMMDALMKWRADITNVQDHILNTSPNGGPAVVRMYKHTVAMRGDEVEARLNLDAAWIDQNADALLAAGQ